MTTLKVAAFISIFFFSTIIAFAQNNPQTNTNIPKIPEGMEAVQIGGSAQLIIPKGAKTRKVGAEIIVEGTKEYMARNIEEINVRLAKIEKVQDDLKQTLEVLKEAVKNLEKSVKPSEQ